MQLDPNLAVAGRRFRHNPWLGAWKQDEQATLGASMFKRDPQQRLDELAKDDLAGHGLRGFDDARYIELLDRRANGYLETIPHRSNQLRVKPIELVHLAVSTPAQITSPGVPEIGVGSGFEATRCVEQRGQLMGQGLVLHKTMFARQRNGLFVETHRVQLPAFEAGDFGRYEGILVAEAWPIDFGPLAQLVA